VRIGMTNLRRWRTAFIADRRGAVSVEMLIIYPVLVTGILLPLADVGIAGLRWLAASQALHAFGQSIQYNPPPDVTDVATWKQDAIDKALAELDLTITNFQVMCDGAVCSDATVAAVPKYYTFQTTVTLTPMVLSSVLCSNSCTYTFSYAARFQ
jgi:Flp pilus assembly protein TadG